MNIELEKLLQFINETNNDKFLSINEAYSLFFTYLKEFKRIDTFKYHYGYFKTTINFYDAYNIKYTNQLTNETILKFITWCKSNNNKNTTINKKIGSIKYMLNFLFKKDLISRHNITIEKLASDEERFKIIEKADLKRIIEYSKNYPYNYQLQINLLISTGIRRTELVKIKLCDINLKDNSIYLSHTKSNRPRTIFIDDYTKQLIIKMMKVNKIYLFENETHTGHINPDNMNNLINRIKKDLNLKDLSPHMFRHTFATTLLENGADLESIRLLLGHSDYSMLMRYVHIKNKRLAEISTSLNPLNIKY